MTSTTPVIRRVQHIAVVVADIDEALQFWQEALGLKLDHLEDLPDQESVIAFLPAGESQVELVKPTNDTSGIARYLAKRGPGVHHICLEVDDIDAMVARLTARGIMMINPEPIPGPGGRRMAFIHPRSSGGVLVELYQLPQ